MSVFAENHDSIAIVPVRAGSKGLTKKNVRLFNGKPLFLHTAFQALRVVGKVVITTDIAEIREMEMPADCSVCWRPDELCGDDVPMSTVIDHVIRNHDLAGYTLVLLQATSPLRSDQDIWRALDLFGTGSYSLVMTVTKKDSAALKHGTLCSDRYVPLGDQEDCFKNRQQLRSVYGPNGAVYVFGADQFVADGGFPSGRIGAVEVPFERSIDIDSEDDLRLAERLSEYNDRDETASDSRAGGSSDRI